MKTFFSGWTIPVCIGVLIILAGCSGPRPALVCHRDISRPGPAARAQATCFPTIFNLARGLALQLKTNYRQGDLSSCTCVVTTFVDIDDLSRSSEFGRLLSEAIGAELFRYGGAVLDVRQARSLMVRPGTGELMLSRDTENLRGGIDAGTVMVGTYGVGRSSVAITARIVEISTRRVLSVAMAEIARNPTIDALLNGSVSPEPTAYDRMP